MGYKCLFMDNGIYTAQDVNGAIGNMISDGISGYPFGGDALSDLNAAVAELVNGGTQYKGASCLVVNIGGTYKISEGACFMNDGSQIIFDEDGYEIEHQSGVYEYVYLERDVLHNTVNVVVSGESGGENTIPLAEIKADGSVLDRRRFAKSKIALAAEPENISVTLRMQFTVPGRSSYMYDVGFNGWKYVIVRYGENLQYIAVIELNDNDMTAIFPQGNTADGSGGLYPHQPGLTVTRRGSVLEIENSITAEAIFNVEVEVR